MIVRFNCNGRSVQVETPPMARLLDVLREDLRLVGSKEGCGEGECGACTVRVDGEPVMSCLVPVAQIEGCRVQTIEGLGNPIVHAVQTAMLASGGAQCGICTPGIAVCAAHVIDRGLVVGQDAATARAQVRELLAGNICRCTGYKNIVASIQWAAEHPLTSEVTA